MSAVSEKRVVSLASFLDDVAEDEAAELAKLQGLEREQASPEEIREKKRQTGVRGGQYTESNRLSQKRRRAKRDA